jgi:hypothetical protein
MSKKKDKKGIIRYEQNKQLSIRDVEANRRAFETPAREVTISDIYSYYDGSNKAQNNKSSGNKQDLIPFLRQQLPSILTKYNTLEENRRRRGFDKTRIQIEKAIREMLSYGEGYRRLTEFQKKYDIDYWIGESLAVYLGKRKFEIHDDDERLNLAMSLTSEEITWVSALRKVPKTIFDHKLASVPTVVDKFYDGVEWGLDSISAKDNPELPKDTFAMAGVTGARADTEFCYFEGRMKAALQGLYIGWIADSYIFSRCVDELGSAALVSGDKKLLSLFAAQDGVPLDDSYALKNRLRLNEWISSCKVINIVDQNVWMGQEFVKLIGILETVPKCISEQKKVAFIACGKGLMFLNPATAEEIEYAPFDPFVSHIAENEIHYSGQAIDRGNPIWHFIFTMVGGWIAEKNKSEGNVSKLERMAETIYKKYGVKVVLGVEKRATDAHLRSFVGDTTPIEYSVKIGYWDLYNVDNVFSKVPRWHLEGVKTVRRSAYGIAAKEIMTGTTHQGSYHHATKELELYIPGYNDPDNYDEDRLLSPGIDSTIYALTIAHETGHAVYVESAWIRDQWKKISDAHYSYPIKKRASGFLTPYASTSVEEDFAEHYACYLLLGHQFRKEACVHPAIDAKYEFMKKVFDDKEYESIDQTPLKYIRGPIEFDYKLRARLLEESVDSEMRGEAMSIEALRKDEFRNSRDRLRRLEGPRIHPIEAIDDPSKMKKVDPRNFIDEIVFDFKRVIDRVFERKFKEMGAFVDSGFIAMRINAGDVETAILDIMNSTGCPIEEVRPVVEKCAADLQKLLERIEESRKEEDRNLEEAEKNESANEESDSDNSDDDSNE